MSLGNDGLPTGGSDREGTGPELLAEESVEGQTDPTPIVASMQEEFQELMEHLGDALNTSVGATIQA
jgi:hypothetical protein